MKVKSDSEVAQSCLTLSDPMDCSLPGSSIDGVFQARVLEWAAIAFSYRIYFISNKNKAKISKGDHFKLKSFCTSKEIINITEKKTTDREKYLQIYKYLIYKYLIMGLYTKHAKN